MGRLRRLLLTALPKLALSRSAGLLARLPLPRRLRGPTFRAFARRYGANLAEMVGQPEDYASMAAFFQRALQAGARPVADAPLVWPADGKVVTAGPIENGRVPQVKGMDYALADLLMNSTLADLLAQGSQVTVYLSPGDYHRVHSPFDGELIAIRHLPGGLFPVNPGAAQSIPELFARNERVVLEYRLPGGRPAAVILVAALNVSDTSITCEPGQQLRRGDEVGRFGLGSTVVAVVGAGTPEFDRATPEQVVRFGRGCSLRV